MESIEVQDAILGVMARQYLKGMCEKRAHINRKRNLEEKNALD